jgi:hypothetical protein
MKREGFLHILLTTLERGLDNLYTIGAGNLAMEVS